MGRPDWWRVEVVGHGMLLLLCVMVIAILWHAATTRDADDPVTTLETWYEFQDKKDEVPPRLGEDPARDLERILQEQIAKVDGEFPVARRQLQTDLNEVERRIRRGSVRAAEDRAARDQLLHELRALDESEGEARRFAAEHMEAFYKNHGGQR